MANVMSRGVEEFSMRKADHEQNRRSQSYRDQGRDCLRRDCTSRAFLNSSDVDDR